MEPGAGVSQETRIGSADDQGWDGLQLLLEISQALLASNDLTSFLERSARRIREVGAWDLIAIRLTDPSGYSPERSFELGYSDEANILTAPGFPRPPGQPPPRMRELSETDPVVIEDLTAVDGYRALKREGLITFIWVPIRVGEAFLGHLVLGSRTPRLIRQDEVRVLRAAGNQIGLASQKAQLIDERLQAADELRRTEESLRRAELMDTIGQLAGGLAHHYNNLLTIINGFAGITLGQMAPDDPKRASIEEIREAGTRAADITAQFLAFSGGQMLRPVATDLNALVRDNEEALRARVGPNIKLEIEVADQPDPVRIDPGRFGQILLNLADNARDAMPDGGQLTIRTISAASGPAESSRSPREQASLTIKDTGTGMAPDVVAHLFEPFFTTKGRANVVGMSLPSAYGIVKQSGGDIRIETELGKGTEITILVPVAPQPVE
jgi:signal transduction histidine kinase